ncbi:hypothetical protein [Lignipirellula cremea]|uniref:Uncharacterized protein n=1 Tax=Lignipirellula cremea TaxID=2528010 RepID=A0A518E0A4_9BACT|nr:hypothetical protein [Lignipirellula cremea]QDU97517.1 hypothetical protein Pla8534_53650 [Lignipirellula cremea]
MFAARYFSPRFFTPKYWPPTLVRRGAAVQIEARDFLAGPSAAASHRAGAAAASEQTAGAAAVACPR